MNTNEDTEYIWAGEGSKMRGFDTLSALMYDWKEEVDPMMFGRLLDTLVAKDVLTGDEALGVIGVLSYWKTNPVPPKPE